jgi:SpoU rRNA methylase family enzyme
VWKIILLVSRWLEFFLIGRYVAGTDEGQLVVVPHAVATAAAAVVPRAKGSALSAGGEILALTAVRDEAGDVSRRLKELKEALSQVR